MTLRAEARAAVRRTAGGGVRHLRRQDLAGRAARLPSSKSWDVEVVEADVRVGGTSIVRMGPEGREPDTETRVYTVVDRPHRLELRYSMALADDGPSRSRPR